MRQRANCHAWMWRLALAIVSLLGLLAWRISATLCISHDDLEYMVLEVRRHIVRDALPEDLQVGSSDRSQERRATPNSVLDRVRRYTPEVQDTSLCFSTDGPFCGILPASPRVPIYADGARFKSEVFVLAG
eukprot:gnl/TRDRNA2_/TRDRNA2_190839_c0_seq1.p1 gnl/TRDRNA2_/TRDRNA2_190839_c0~~gnl/TRDRNA2_/TRDRNA2_190839_c0_seq1.p1  ORF type:complete len:131 (-),score=16.25 gnl/TRDRNA2_/TRDRNA2_190839_c0_seq1:58-450(-)